MPAPAAVPSMGMNEPMTAPAVAPELSPAYALLAPTAPPTMVPAFSAILSLTTNLLVLQRGQLGTSSFTNTSLMVINEQPEAESPGATGSVCGRESDCRMSGDEGALHCPEHRRREFLDLVDNTAGIREKGEYGCVCDADSVNFHA